MKYESLRYKTPTIQIVGVFVIILSMNKGIKIICWNVNGIRAIERKGNWGELLKHDADIYCLQETKANPEQLTTALRNPDGYHSYFSWPTEKKGYSGVAIYSKEKPLEVAAGIGMNGDDDEGRVLTAIFSNFVLITCYFPNGGGGPERLAYKLKFYDEFLEYIEDLKKKHKNIIFCGDVNTAHNEIDLARPKENEMNTGFLPEERAWMDQVVDSGWIDVFRQYFPSKPDMYTYWDMKTRARDRNVGWRIDYFFATPSVLQHTESIEILSRQLGSDHAPLCLQYKV